MNFNYDEFVSRNSGYISEEQQHQIARTRVLIAGCGIGSQVAEAAARVGFCNFKLVDADTIDRHNLNRQSFFFDQVGKLKVDALRENILRINPEAKVSTVPAFLNAGNAKPLVSEADLVFDTIDFLDLAGIVALHDEAHRQKKHLISSFAVGFGAAVISFKGGVGHHALIRDIFDLPPEGDIGEVSYVERFIRLFSTLAPGLDPAVVTAMQRVFQELADGKMCPAPQVSPGAHAVAAASVTAAVRILNDQTLSLAPGMVVVNLTAALQGEGFALGTRLRGD